MIKHTVISDPCLNLGIERTKDLEISDELSGWYFDKVLSQYNIENYSFYFHSPKRHYTDEICPQDIIGTTHPSYYDLTWIEMLGSLQRYSKLPPERTIYNINDETIIEKKSIAKYANLYLISGGGNHRICLAKFLGLEKIKVEITEYEFDQESFRIHNIFQALGLNTKYYRSQDETVWELETNKFHLWIYGSDLAEKFTDFYNSISINPKDYLKILWHNYKGRKFECYHNIRSESQFYSLKFLIIANKYDLTLI